MQSMPEVTPPVKGNPPRIALPYYIATASLDIVGLGGPLLPFLEGLLEEVSESGEDLAVWLVPEDDGSPPRLVAALRPGPDGQGQVVWL